MFEQLIKILFISLWISVLVPAQEEDPVSSITKAELQDQIFYLASDELGGRDTGSEGYAMAALYAVTQFKKSGLEPLIVGDKGQKTFFQSVSFESFDAGSQSALILRSPEGEVKLNHGEEMILFRTPSADENIFSGEKPVFLGYGIDDPEIGWSDYAHVDVRGKVIFMYGGAPSKQGEPFFSPEKDRHYRNFGQSANARIISAVKHGVSAVVFIPDPPMAKNWSRLSSSMIRRQFILHMEERGAADFPAIFFMHPDAAEEMLADAAYDWAYGNHDYKPAVLEKIEVSCTLEKDNARQTICKNVVALLPGTDPELKEEYIVLHAHLDHLGLNSSGQVMNGADDNASGSAVILEIAEALAMKPAKRSFLFVLFTGEEKGTLGSQWFVNHLPVPEEKIVLNAAVDMIGRQSTRRPDVIYVIAEGRGSDRLLEIATHANESRIQAEIDLSLNEKDPDGHIMRCDVTPFLTKNIPSLLFTRGFMSPVYHSPRDDAETLNYDKIEKASRLLYLVLREVGSGSSLDSVR
jgi:hypothetical protein